MGGDQSGPRETPEVVEKHLATCEQYEFDGDLTP